MSTDNLMQILHDRATRGETLSATEKTRLKAWYKAQDERESDLLNKNATQDSLAERKKQIQKTLSEIQECAAQFRKISAENDVLRQENEILREQLAEKLLLKTV